MLNQLGRVAEFLIFRKGLCISCTSAWWKFRTTPKFPRVSRRIPSNHLSIAFRATGWWRWWARYSLFSRACFPLLSSAWTTNIIMSFYSWWCPIVTFNQMPCAYSAWFTSPYFFCFCGSFFLPFLFFRFTFALHASSSNTADKLWVTEIKSRFIFFTGGTVYKLTWID